MAVELSTALAGWMNCGTIGLSENVLSTPEPIVDNTFRVVTAFDELSGLQNVTGDLVNHSLTITDAGKYSTDLFLKFDGSNKIFEFALFINGVQSSLTINDKAFGSETVSPVLDLPAGAVLDVRQRSVDGGTALVIHYGGFSLTRLT